MIDIHSHILYDIEGDDGSRSETMSLGMLRQAAASGTTHIFATPHMHRHEVVPSWSSIEERVAELQQKADAEGIPITIHTGAEVSLDYDTLQYLPGGENTDYCLGGTHYLLVELTPQSEPEMVSKLFYELQLRGYILILAHPERYHRIMRHPETVFRWMQDGLLTQSNVGSFDGLFGEDAQKNVENLYRHHMICFLGSDGHRTDWRNPDTRKAHEAIDRFTGSGEFWETCSRNAEMILKNRVFYPKIPDAYEMKRKGFFARLFGK